MLSNTPPTSLSICCKHNEIGGCVHLDPRVTLSGYCSCHIVRASPLRVLAQIWYSPPKSISIWFRYSRIGGCVHVDPCVTMCGHHSCHIVLTPPFCRAFPDHTRVWAQKRVQPPKYQYLYYKSRGLRPRRPSCDIMLTSPT